MYIGNFEYNTLHGDAALTNLNRIYNDEGYVETPANPQYYYYRKDHLGDNREVWCANTNTVMQRTQYYPSGLPWAYNPGDNPDLQHRKYNGKEFDEMHGYDTYDYGARGYYAAMGRFTSVDPLAEKYPNVSSYVYCVDNPVIYIDPDGKEKIISLNPNVQRNSHLINAANKYTDDKAIHIWAHGNSKSMLVYVNGKDVEIKSAKDFQSFLSKNSKTWQNKGENEHLTIILHSCETGKENGKEPSLAREISKDLKNTTVIAPTEKVVIDKSETEMGSYSTKTVEDNGQTKIVTDGKGNWDEFSKGEKTESHPGDWKPSNKPEILTGSFSLVPNK